ncbi:hypothetical protein BK640_06920 [Pseudomonas protegens]|nr:hypothetical protein BK639_23615 [Pseudomonas protegens]ROM02071.1 hypothetical protein BK641_16475 [Pseudomonas protegens]ROM04448.1 hypothetical protein BK642_22380 [Pseudomonas protegens]ROM08943.1 hypothetical protein BK640_06920 [Pseudomonas protegens]
MQQTYPFGYVLARGVARTRLGLFLGVGQFLGLLVDQQPAAKKTFLKIQKHLMCRLPGSI